VTSGAEVPAVSSLKRRLGSSVAASQQRLQMLLRHPPPRLASPPWAQMASVRRPTSTCCHSPSRLLLTPVMISRRPSSGGVRHICAATGGTSGSGSSGKPSREDRADPGKADFSAYWALRFKEFFSKRKAYLRLARQRNEPPEAIRRLDEQIALQEQRLEAARIAIRCGTPSMHISSTCASCCCALLMCTTSRHQEC
jgi:hypothetical protein